jgi:hypothetical protein
MGTEFARTQDLMVEEIDRLRKRCGEYDGNSYLDNMVQKAFRDNWTNPKKHPANSRLAEKTSKVDVPPKKPSELLDESEVL